MAVKTDGSAVSDNDKIRRLSGNAGNRMYHAVRFARETPDHGLRRLESINRTLATINWFLGVVAVLLILYVFL